MPNNPEAFSRVLIDCALTDSGWDLLDPRQVRFEIRAGGRAHYALLGNRGMALAPDQVPWLAPADVLTTRKLPLAA
ncbi:MAG: hypothetical protein HY260_11845 [Chloroflexi bacterium]|nr:hypothetical protein [Chloroflexota bacterium]